VYNTLIEGVDVRWLIDHRRLAPYEYYAPTLVDTDGLRVVRGDYVTSDLDKLMNERAIYGDVIKSYRKFAEGERSIAYCVSVEHAKRTADAFNSVGIRAEAISADTPPRRRQAIMEDFRAGLITVLCNVGIIAEGISISEVSACLLLRPTESVALAQQQQQRCMRYLPGKTAKILDFVGNYLRVGTPDTKYEWSLTEPIKKRRELDSAGNFYIRCCPECYMTFPTAPKCPYCGAEYPLHPREIKAKEDIEIRRVSEEEARKLEEVKKQSRIQQGRAQSFEELVKLGKSRGYKNPAYWAAQVMRGRKR
jgi:superfamily II DNA or RNA helicase